MNEKNYEIWRHEGSQTWKVFIDMTDELRSTLLNTGWNPVTRYKEGDIDSREICPEEVLRRVSRRNLKS